MEPVNQPCKYCKKTNNEHTNRCPTTGVEICDKIADIPSDWIYILQTKIPITPTEKKNETKNHYFQ
jgi:hypothetical protein